MPRRHLPSLPRVVLVLAMALLGLSAAAATPCAACSCERARSLVDSAAEADVVFVGTAVGTREAGRAASAPASSGDQVARVFEVTQVRKGVAAARTEVRTAASEASCGLEVREGGTYVVVARSTPAGLTSGLCDGSRLLTIVTATELDAVGALHAPQPGALAADLTGPVSPVRDVVGSPLALGAVLAALAGLAALVGLAATLVLRRRRHDAEPPGDPLR